MSIVYLAHSVSPAVISRDREFIAYATGAAGTVTGEALASETGVAILLATAPMPAVAAYAQAHTGD